MWFTIGLKFLTPCLLLSSSVRATTSNKFRYERLDRNDSILLIVDMQVGLYQLVRDLESTSYKSAMIAHASLGKFFDIPVVMTTSAQTGPNGLLPREITDLYPDAPLIERQGEVNAWDNPEFRDTVRSFNRSQIIVAGILTDVCTAFLALSLRDEGYSVWANAEASGTSTSMVREDANDRMRGAGVHVISLFGIVGELMRDWRNPYSAHLLSYFDSVYPALGMLARYHRSSIENGTVTPGELELPV